MKQVALITPKQAIRRSALGHLMAAQIVLVPKGSKDGDAVKALNRTDENKRDGRAGIERGDLIKIVDCRREM